VKDYVHEQKADVNKIPENREGAYQLPLALQHNGHSEPPRNRANEPEQWRRSGKLTNAERKTET